MFGANITVIAHKNYWLLFHKTADKRYPRIPLYYNISVIRSCTHFVLYEKPGSGTLFFNCLLLVVSSSKSIKEVNNILYIFICYR